jgi:hypothetical protein
MLLNWVRTATKPREPERLQDRVSRYLTSSLSRKAPQALRVSNILREFFGVGDVIPNRRYDNHREHMYRYVVRCRNDLLEAVIPFFRKHQM